MAQTLLSVRPRGEADGTDKDGAALETILARRAGEGFRPLVRTHSRRDGEWTFIFARPASEGRLELMLVSHDSSDTVVIRAVVDPDRMLAHINEPHAVVKIARN